MFTIYFKNQFKTVGWKNEKGDTIQVCFHHIVREKVVSNIKDWENGIFISPSIFYSGYEVYSNEIDWKNETWKVLL